MYCQSVLDENKTFSYIQLKEFESAHSSELGTSTRAVKQAIEAGEANVKWMEKNYQNIWRWLKIQQEEAGLTAN